MTKYNPKQIESKWNKIWEDSELYKAVDNDKREKYYCLDMFPYPSGSGLHVGHWRGYVLSDVMARYQMLNGKNVLHPMGWDAFGLPAENAAIKDKSHPKVYTEKAINNFRNQIKQIGTCIDWSREINTSAPEYYKWTQWLFLQLYKNKLAYRKNAPVNWCPSCQTVLANEQVVAGECERCDSTVTKKDLTQWFFRITDFADDLLKDLDKIDWPERTKTLQRNWIGKSEGTEINFPIKNLELSIKVFTTRADTLFGCTYIVLSPENDLIQKIKNQISNIKIVEDYIIQSKKKTDIDRTDMQKDKTGVKLEGIKAVNPINNKEIDVWVADYVLASYGTGAVMAVPAHDERDFEFAKKYDIDIISVIQNSKIPAFAKAMAGKQDQNDNVKTDKAFTDYGFLFNSGEFDGLASKEAQNKITEKLKENNAGDFITSYKLRDWLISRQRYWGAPIPIIYCDKCGEVPVPEEELPVKLPEDVEFSPNGDSPLKQSKTFTDVKCPKCSGNAKRETDTMDTFVCSSWYYLRYTDPHNDKQFATSDMLNYWLPVDTYVGGVEHAILHLLYARFISKALHKHGYLDFNSTGEPFTKLFNIGMVYLHGAKMSKSKGNVVSPDILIEKYGTDALRGYELFIGPAEADSQWQVGGISGVYRFLEKVWQIYQNKLSDDDKVDIVIEKSIRDVTNDIINFQPNTAISNLMILFNHLSKTSKLSKKDAERICVVLSPFFPHLAEEIWELLGHKDSVFKATWPTFDKDIIKEEKVNLVVSINGKHRDTISVAPNLSQTDAEKIVKENEKVKSLLENKSIKKVIYVSGRIINFVLQ